VWQPAARRSRQGGARATAYHGHNSQTSSRRSHVARTKLTRDSVSRKRRH
jgi:hypothetical protein